MSFIFHNFFYKPLLNTLAGLTYLIPGHSFGTAIIVLTLIVNTILLPLTHRAKHTQRKMQELAPELEKIKRQFKNKRDEQARRQMELYRQHGVNPFGTILLPIIQIPLFLALFRVLKLQGDIFLHDLYAFMPTIPTPEKLFLNSIDLARPGLEFHLAPQFSFHILILSNVLLALFAAVFQFVQLQLLPRQKNVSTQAESFSAVFQQNLTYTMPVIVFLIGSTLPAALSLYWTVMSLFGIVHEGIVRRRAETFQKNYGDANPTTE